MNAATLLLVSLVIGFQSPASQADKPVTPLTPIGPYKIVINDATFATRVMLADGSYLAEDGKKFLVLNYSVHNEHTEKLPYHWSMLDFWVVDGEDTRHDYSMVVSNPKTKKELDVELMPKQSVTAMTFIEIPANDPVRSLNIAYEDGQEIKFDLTGKVKKFTGPYADPNGISVLDIGQGKLGEKLDGGIFDVTVEKVEESLRSVDTFEVDESEKLILVTVNFTNATLQDQRLDWASFYATMEDAGAEPIDWLHALLVPAGNAPIDQILKPAQSAKGRMVFRAPRQATPAKLAMEWGQGQRVLEIALR